jgi:predicted double-glycine peptidase
MAHGAEVLHRIAAQAVARFLHNPHRALILDRLFTAAELAELSAAIAATNATADLLGRAMVRDWQQQVIARNGITERVAETRQNIPNPMQALAVPVRLQSTDYSCGAAALRAVLDYWGIDETEAAVVRQLGTDAVAGTRPAEIVAVARKLGLAVEERHGATWEDLRHSLSLGCPLLAPVQMHGGGHWVVIAGVDARGVHLMDPASGAVTVSSEAFAAAWHDRDVDGQEYLHYAIAVGRPPVPVRESVLREELTSAPVEPLPPEAAVSYFRGLVPTLGVDPQRFGQDQRRRAFTLAAATDQQLLGTVQGLIADRLKSGQQFRAAPGEIDQLLADAGVSPKNPQYSEMVFRTNMMDAYTTASDAERRDPDVIATFPVWKYSNPHDSRSRPTHAERNGWYYPADVPFVTVRGTGIEDAANCRCVPIPVDKWDWARLRAGGARIADGYPDVPTASEQPAPTPAPQPTPTPAPVQAPVPAPGPAPTPIGPPPSAPAPPAVLHPDTLLQAFAAVDAATVGTNFVSLTDLWKAMPGVSREAFHATINQLRQEGVLTLAAAEGREGISAADRAAGIYDKDWKGDPIQLMLYAMVRPEQAARLKAALAKLR